MNNSTVKGFLDFLGPDSSKRERIKKIIQRQFELYGFESAETPIIENEEFVKGENKEDDAVRDVFKLQDRGERKLALRYEFTFQLKRIAKNQKLPYKRYQIGYNFRDEPVRKGRLRQFIQCDADIIGSTIKDEAEILSLGKNIFNELKIPVKIYVNNRMLLNEILVSEDIKEKNRPSVIRELDKLDKLSKKQVADNLKKYNAESLIKIFDKPEEYFEKYGSYKKIKELKEYCKEYGFEIEFRPFLSRGFSYYKGNVFEIWSDELNVSLCGGGNYLVEEASSFGISFGLEPIFLLSDIKGEFVKIQIISINQDKEAIRIAQRLREEGIKTLLILDKSPSKAIEYANSKNIDYVLFVGEKEVSERRFKLKDMTKGNEKNISLENLIELLR